MSSIENGSCHFYQFKYKTGDWIDLIVTSGEVAYNIRDGNIAESDGEETEPVLVDGEETISLTEGIEGKIYTLFIKGTGLDNTYELVPRRADRILTTWKKNQLNVPIEDPTRRCEHQEW